MTGSLPFQRRWLVFRVQGMNTAVLPAPVARFSPLVLACLAATWLIWGSTYLAIKFALLSFPPFWQMGSRFLAAGVLLMAWMRWGRGAPWPTGRQWLHASGVGALMLGGGMGGTAFAEQTVGSGLVVTFIAVVPVLMALGGLAFGQRLKGLEVAGIAVGIGGVLLLTQGASFAASPQGLAAIAIACACWTAGSLLSQHRWPLAPGAMGFASEMLAGGAFLMALALLRGEALAPLQPLAVGAWAYLVVAGSLLAFNAYMVLLAETPPAVASSYCFVNPVIALLLGVGFAGETVTAMEWAAAGVVLAAVALLLSAKR
jgi:drug/metabolite transporter (DMT)-like permease